MKCVDYIIKIPGCDDILFCAGLSFETGTGAEIYAGIKPFVEQSSGRLNISYYVSEGMSWIYDWLEMMNIFSKTRATISSYSIATQKFLRRKILIYALRKGTNDIIGKFTLHNVIPISLTYPEQTWESFSLSSTTRPENPEVINFSLNYDYCEREFY